jgi:hypothetical protein
MIRLQDKVNTDAPDSDYPFGKVRNDSGIGDGTPVDFDFLHDYTQFFEKLMSESGITPNGLPDNEYSGFQLYEAFRKMSRPYRLYSGLLSQSGTSAPVFTSHFDEFAPFFNIVWTRTSAGIYKGTSAGAFAGKRGFLIGPGSAATTLIRGSISNDNEIQLFTFDQDLTANTNTLTDSLLINVYIEIKIFD